MKLAVSATAFRNLDVAEAIHLAIQNNFVLEFSSGIPYRPDLVQLVLNAKCARMIHNYFPAPEDPFVLNLASLNPRIRRRSLEHVRQCLNLTSQIGAGFYSVHAGFCMDPDPKELGQPFALKMHNSREQHWQVFMETVDELLDNAEKEGVHLLIENNVLARFNMKNGLNPTLCADPVEIHKLFAAFPGRPLKLLLDTGHWYVSAKTLDFDPVRELSSIEQFVGALHHSDNDGLEDTNGPLSDAYWFLPQVKRFLAAYHIIEVHDQSPSEISQQYDLLMKFAKG